jgi:hypothetical protein
MNSFKSVVLVLCLCNLCSKAAIHTYRHFHPPAAVAVP